MRKTSLGLTVSKRKRRLTSPGIGRELRENRSEPESYRTDVRALQMYGFNGTVAIWKYLLLFENVNVDKRYTWAKKYTIGHRNGGRKSFRLKKWKLNISGSWLASHDFGTSLSRWAFQNILQEKQNTLFSLAKSLSMLSLNLAIWFFFEKHTCNNF